MFYLLGAVFLFLFIVAGIEFVLNLGLVVGLAIWLLCAWGISAVFNALYRRVSED